MLSNIYGMLLQLATLPVLFGLACGETAKDALKSLSLTIRNTMHECQEEIRFGPELSDDFMQYWNYDYPLMNREMGCAVMCVLLKLQLSDDQGHLKVANAEGFTMASGADENTAKTLIQLYQHCRDSVSEIEPCTLTLQVSDCFRERVREMDWTPEFM